MGVVLSDEIREKVEASATANGVSIGEEIRRRLLLTLQQDALDQPVREFGAEMAILADLATQQTGLDWRTHPAANAMLRHAILARLARTKESGPETFAPGELPENSVVAPGSDDPQVIGAALEAYLDVMLDLMEPSGAEWVLLNRPKKAARKAKEMLPPTETLPPKEMLPPNPPEKLDAQETLPPEAPWNDVA